MTPEQALLALDDAGEIGYGDPDCDCDRCELSRELRPVVDALREQEAG